jgi:hypothetical protein
MKKNIIFIAFSLLASTSFALGPGAGAGRTHSASSSTGKRQYKYYLGAGYNIQSKETHSSTTDSTSASSYASEISYSNAASIEAGIANIPDGGFGYSAGISYELPRSVSSNRQNGVDYPGSDAQIQVTNLIVGTSYRISYLYLPFSLSYSLVSFKAPTGYTGSFDAKGGLGAMGGFGFFLGSSDKVAFEAQYRYSSLSLSTKDPATNFSQDFGNGNLSSLNFSLKLFF